MSYRCVKEWTFGKGFGVQVGEIIEKISYDELYGMPIVVVYTYYGDRAMYPWEFREHFEEVGS